MFTELRRIQTKEVRPPSFSRYSRLQRCHQPGSIADRMRLRPRCPRRHPSREPSQFRHRHLRCRPQICLSGCWPSDLRSHGASRARAALAQRRTPTPQSETEFTSAADRHNPVPDPAPRLPDRQQFRLRPARMQRGRPITRSSISTRTRSPAPANRVRNVRQDALLGVLSTSANSALSLLLTHLLIKLLGQVKTQNSIGSARNPTGCQASPDGETPERYLHLTM